MRKFCIINTCGREDCSNHEQDHEHGAYYLVQDVDAHIAELEKSHERYEKLRRLDPQRFHSLWMSSLLGDRFDDLVDRLPT